MTIEKTSRYPQVREDQTIGLVGVDSGTVYDRIPRGSLDGMDPWSFEESLAIRDHMLGETGVTETLRVEAVPIEETENAGMAPDLG